MYLGALAPRARAPRMDVDLGTTDAPSKRARARALVSPDPRLASVARKVEAWV